MVSDILLLKKHLNLAAFTQNGYNWTWKFWKDFSEITCVQKSGPWSLLLDKWKFRVLCLVSWILLNMFLAWLKFSMAAHGPIRWLSFTTFVNDAFLMSDGADFCIFKWVLSLCYCSPLVRHIAGEGLTPLALSQGDSDQTKRPATEDDITPSPRRCMCVGCV